MMNFMFKFQNLIANGTQLEGEVNSQSFIWTIIDFVSGIFGWLANGIMTIIYAICKWALNLIDFVQFFCEKLIGLDFWYSSKNTIADLGETDILFRFMFSDEVMRVFKFLIIISIILLIIFSIVAIVRNEYSSAATGKGESKRGILNGALKAIFMVVMIPIIMIFGILASNAILASLLNALKGDNNLTMGGQIFVSSAYGANKYRICAEEGNRTPTIYAYTFYYNEYEDEANGYTYIFPLSETDVNGNKSAEMCYKFKSATTERSGNGDMHYYILGEFVDERGITRTSDKPEVITDLSGFGAEYKTYNKGSKQYTFDSLPSSIKSWKNSATNGLIYSLPNPQNVAQTDYLLFDIDYSREMAGLDKLAKFHYLTAVLNADVYTSNLASIKNLEGNAEDWASVYPENYMLHHNGTYTLDTSSWTSRGAIIDDCSSKSLLIDIVYNGWSYLENFDEYNTSFENAINFVDITWTTESRTFSFGEAKMAQNSKNTWQYFDGGAFGLTPIKQEYFVLADFIDYAVKKGFSVSVVNSQSSLIDWSNVSQDYRVQSDATGLMEFAVNYKDVGNVVYKPTNFEREDQGAVYLMCYIDSSTGLYRPFINGTNVNVEGVEAFTFNTGYINATGCPIVSRGVFDGSVIAGNPVASSVTEEIYKSSDGNTLSSTDAQYVKLEASNEFVTNTVAQDKTLTVALNSSVSSMFNLVQNTTGGTHVDYSYNISDVLSKDFITAANASLIKAAFPEALANGFVYANTNANDSISIDEANKKVTISIKNTNTNAVYNLIITYTATGTKLVQFVIDGVPGYSYDALTSLGFTRPSVTIYNADGTVNDARDIWSILAVENTDYFAIDAPASMFNRHNFIMELLDNFATAKVNGADANINAGSCILKSDGHYRLTSTKDSTEYYTEAYVSSNLIELIPYSTYNLTTNGTTFSAVSGLNAFGSVVGYGTNYSYFYYDGQTYQAKTGTTSSGREYCYLTATTSIISTTYSYKYYSGFAFMPNAASGEIYNIKTYKSDASNEEMPPIAVKTFVSILDSSNKPLNILDKDGKYLFGVKCNNIFLSSNVYAHVYANGELVTTVKYREPGSAEDTNLNTLLAIQNGPSETRYIVNVDLGSVSYTCVPAYTADQIANAKKPAYISYVHNKISGDLFLDICVSPWRFKVDYAEGITDAKSIFNLSNSSFRLDYNFNTKTGIGLNYLYEPSQINVIVLVFATVLVFKVLMTSAWGLVKRIYDVTILFMIMPGVASTRVMDDGKRFGTWSTKLIKTIFGAYGVMIGLNIFFVLVPMIDGATSNLFTISDLPDTIKGTWLFERPDYINMLITLMFTLVALTLITTLPAYISDILDFGDVYKDGSGVKSEVNRMVKDVTDVTSGANALKAYNDITGRDPKTGKYNLMNSSLAKFVPGSSLASAAWDKFNRMKGNKEEKEKKEKKAYKDAEQAASSGGNNNGGGGNGGTPPFSGRSDHAREAEGLVPKDPESREYQGNLGTAMPGSVMDANTSENEMARFAEDFKNAADGSAERNAAGSDYQNAYNTYTEASANNAMVNGGGEFTTREGSLDNVKNNLAVGFEAAAYKTDKVDDVTGEAIWAVKIRQKTSEEITRDTAIRDAVATEERLSEDISSTGKLIDGIDNSVAGHQAILFGADTEFEETEKSLKATFGGDAAGWSKFSALSRERDTHQREVANLDTRINSNNTRVSEINTQESRLNNEYSYLDLQTRNGIGKNGKPLTSAELAANNTRMQEIKNTLAQNNTERATLTRDTANAESSKTNHQTAVTDRQNQIKSMIGGKNETVLNDLIKKRNDRQNTIILEKSLISDLNKTRNNYVNDKIKQEKDLESATAAREALEKTRDAKKGARVEQESKDAAAKYNTLTKKYDDAEKIAKAMGSTIPVANKERAMDAFIEKHESSSKMGKIAAEVRAGTIDKTSADYTAYTAYRTKLVGGGIKDVVKQTSNEMVTAGAIANGAQVKANKLNGTNRPAPIVPQQQGGNVNGGNSNSGSGNGNGGNGNGGTPPPKFTVKKRTTGSRLSDQYVKFKVASDDGKKGRAKSFVKKMNKTINKAVNVRDAADERYIKAVNTMTGGNAANLQEAKEASANYVAGGKTLNKKVTKAEKKRTKVYTNTQFATGKHAGAGQAAVNIVKAQKQVKTGKQAAKAVGGKYDKKKSFQQNMKDVAAKKMAINSDYKAMLEKASTATDMDGNNTTVDDFNKMSKKKFNTSIRRLNIDGPDKKSIIAARKRISKMDRKITDNKKTKSSRVIRALNMDGKDPNA